MALPLLLALMAASAAANHQAQKKVDKSRDNALAEEARRRKEAQDRATQSANSTAALFTNTGKAQDAKAAEIEAQYAANAPTPGAGPTTSPLVSGFSAPARSTLTVGADTRAFDRARADTAALAAAKAKLNSFGDVMVDNNIAAQRNATDIDQEAAGVRNWNQYVLPQQLARANAAGKDWSTLADALQIAASIYAPYGLGKGAGGLAKAFDVSTSGLTGAGTGIGGGVQGTQAFMGLA